MVSYHAIEPSAEDCLNSSLVSQFDVISAKLEVVPQLLAAYTAVTLLFFSPTARFYNVSMVEIFYTVIRWDCIDKHAATELMYRIRTDII